MAGIGGATLAAARHRLGRRGTGQGGEGAAAPDLPSGFPSVTRALPAGPRFPFLPAPSLFANSGVWELRREPGRARMSRPLGCDREAEPASQLLPNLVCFPAVQVFGGGKQGGHPRHPRRAEDAREPADPAPAHHEQVPAAPGGRKEGAPRPRLGDGARLHQGARFELSGWDHTIEWI